MTYGELQHVPDSNLGINLAGRWEVFCTIHYFKKICVKHLQLGQDFETFHQIQ